MCKNKQLLNEYFEYHVVPQRTYRMTSDNFDFGNDAFWYVCFWEDDTVSGETEDIPYLKNGDYSAYRKVYEPKPGVTGYMFIKGRLGAYVVPITPAQ